MNDKNLKKIQYDKINLESENKKHFENVKKCTKINSNILDKI